MNIEFDMIIDIILECNFYLDHTDVKNLWDEYSKFSLLAKSKKNSKYFGIEVIKYSLYYFQKFYQLKTIMYVDDILLNFIVCVLVSNKFVEDISLDNSQLCKIFGLDLRKVNQHESEILDTLKYNLFVQPTMLNNFIYEKISKLNQKKIKTQA